MSSLALSAASLTGATLGVVVRGLAAVRRPPKPMHPHGCVREGRLYRRGCEPPSGVPFLDERGVAEVVVRESRAIGLPRSWPDIHGLAVKVPLPGVGDGHGDLLFSTTGSGRVTRHLLTPTRGQENGRMSTLFPFRTAAGPVVVSARYLASDTVELAWAPSGQDWRPFADLVLGERQPDDPDLVFDAILHTFPGLEQYDVVQRVRAPSYARARASRSRGVPGVAPTHPGS